MEFLIELVLELLFEGSMEISSNKKISKWIRYPLILMVVILFIAVILLIFILGILMLKENILIGMLFILLSLVFLILSIKKLKSLYKKVDEVNYAKKEI